jgi:homogentisate 1,2-dioxygenase
MRWFEGDMPDSSKELIDFVDGTHTICGAGSPNTKTGIAVHYYLINTSMKKRVMVNADGDLLFVPQSGELTIYTEFGIIKVKPREICVIQRGIRFRVDCETPCRGYMSEIFGGHFVIPDLGPIGSNGLANPKDFETPVAWYEDVEEDYELIHKFCGKLFTAKLPYSPFDVVGWHGNYAPFKYNLDNFNTMNTVSFDHPVCSNMINLPRILPFSQF